MDQQIKKHKTFADADPDAVIVTLFTDEYDDVRGWFVGPERNDRVWKTCPQDNLLAAVAVLEAFELARLTGTDLCVVDPENLWSRLLED